MAVLGAGGRCLASALGGTLGHSWPGSEISLHTPSPLPQPRALPATLSRSVWPLPPARGHALPTRGPEAGGQPRLRGEEIHGVGPLQDGAEPLPVSEAGCLLPPATPYHLQPSWVALCCHLPRDTCNLQASVCYGTSGCSGGVRLCLSHTL